MTKLLRLEDVSKTDLVWLCRTMDVEKIIGERNMAELVLRYKTERVDRLASRGKILLARIKTMRRGRQKNKECIALDKLVTRIQRLEEDIRSIEEQYTKELKAEEAKDDN